jgi:hypothetical protein
MTRGLLSVRLSLARLMALPSGAARLTGITDRMNDKFIYGLSRRRKIEAFRQLR